MSSDRPDAGAPLRIEADLDISVDGVTAHLSHEGERLRLHTEHPIALLGRLAASQDAVRQGRAGLSRMIDEAAARGVSVIASGPHGPTLAVGAGVSSALSRRLVGTSHVRVVTTRAQRLVAAVLVGVVVVHLSRRAQSAN